MSASRAVDHLDLDVLRQAKAQFAPSFDERDLFATCRRADRLRHHAGVLCQRQKRIVDADDERAVVRFAGRGERRGRIAVAPIYCGLG
ncbi:MAG: hypothetical protein ACLQLG_20205 [Thermoguttaceae bacterium]